MKQLNYSRRKRNKFMKTKFEKLENSEAKLIVSLEKDEFEKYHDKALKTIQEVVVIDGFRKGNAPENLIIEKYGEMMLLEEMAHLVINIKYNIANIMYH